MSDDPYSRLYWRFADEYPEVYDNDAAFALWGRLLRVADMAWPSAAPLPFGVRRQALAMLLESGLVMLVTRTTYKVRGMDKERGRRSAHGRAAADARWNAPSIAPSNAQTMPSQVTSQEEPSQDETSPAEQPDWDAAAALYHRTGRYPSEGTVTWLNRLSERHGEERLVGVISALTMTNRNLGDFLRAVENQLRSEDHAAAKAEEKAERDRLAAKREIPRASLRDDPEVRRVLAEISAPVKAVS